MGVDGADPTSEDAKHPLSGFVISSGVPADSIRQPAFTRSATRGSADFTRPATPGPARRRVLKSPDYSSGYDDLFNELEKPGKPAATHQAQLIEEPSSRFGPRGRKVVTLEKALSSENINKGIAFGEKAEEIFANRFGRDGAGGGAGRAGGGGVGRG